MTTELQTTSECGLVIPEGVSTGLEQASMEGLPIPRLKIVQAISKIFKDEHRANIGQVENSVTSEVLSSPFSFVILSIKTGAVYLTKKDGLVCRSDDGVANTNGELCEACPHNAFWKNWDTPIGKPLCSQSYELLVCRRDSLLHGAPDVAVVSLIRGETAVAKQVIQGVKMSGKPIFAKSYIFETKLKQSDNGDYYGWGIRPQGWVTQDEFNVAIRLHDEFGKRKVHDDAPVGKAPAQSASNSEEDIF